MDLTGKLNPSTNNSGVSIYPHCIVGWFLTNDVHQVLTDDYPQMLCKYESGTNQWANYLKRMNEISLETIKCIKSDPSYAKRIYETYLDRAKALEALIDKLLSANEDTGIQDLIRLYHEYSDLYKDTYLYSWLPLGAEGLNSNLSGEIISLISEHIDKVETSLSVGDCFSVLVKHNEYSIREKEEINLCQIYIQLLKYYEETKNHFSNVTEFIIENDDIKNLMIDHHSMFRSMSFDYEGPEISLNQFVDNLVELAEKGHSAEEIIEGIHNDKKNTLDKQKELWDLLEIETDCDLSMLIKTAQLFGVWKSNQQAVLFKSYHAIDHLLKLIASQTQSPKELLRYLLPSELDKYISHGIPSNIDLEERKTFCVIDYKKGNIDIQTGEQALNLWNKFVTNEDVTSIKKLSGQPAYSGLIRGKVKIVNEVADLSSFNDGEVLISSKTNPNLLSAMKKAIAIVTDYGGLTCHAAILAHELKIPTIVGTK